VLEENILIYRDDEREKKKKPRPRVLKNGSTYVTPAGIIY
jgi:hypothetical protein